MTRRAVHWCLAVCAIVPTISAPGCSPPPPSEDVILYYLRNAHVRGPVRRAWPEGQAYLDRIMKRDVALRNELSKLTPVMTVESLWPASDPRWQDKAAVEAHARDLEKLLDLNGQHREACQKELDALQAAVEAVPAGLSFDSPDAKAAFVGRVWDALAVRHVPLREHVADVEATVRARLELCRTVLAASSDFDPAQPGLKFKDAEHQTTVDQQYSTLAERLRSAREAFIARAEQDMVAAAQALQSINKRQQRWQYELLNNERKYLRDELEAMIRDLAARAQQAATQVERLQARLTRAGADQKAEMETQLALDRVRAEELYAEGKAVQSRVAEICRRAGLSAAR